MGFEKVDISGGMVPGVDDLSAASSYVSNFEVDEGGINRIRPINTDLTITGIDSNTTPMVGHTYWPSQGGHIVAVNEDGQVWTVGDALPGTALLRSDANIAHTEIPVGTGVPGTLRPTFVHGQDHVYIARGGVGGGITRWRPSEGLADSRLGQPATSHIATLGNRLIGNGYLGNPHLFYWTEIGEANWGTFGVGNFSEPNTRPDPIKGLFDNGTELFVFGSETLQVYGVGIDPSVPFELINSLSTGTVAGFSPVRMADDRFAFLDHTRQFVISDGRGVERIGDAVLSTVRNFATVDDCFGWREERGQNSYLCWRFPTIDTNLVYDVKGNHWSYRHSYYDSFNRGYRVNSYAYWPKYNYHTFARSDFGNIFRQNDDHSSQTGPVVGERITGWQDFGTQSRKRSYGVRVVMRRGTAAEGVTPGALELRVQNDNGPWSPWKQMTIGVPSDYGQVRDARLGGIFKRRRYNVRFTTHENFSLVSLADNVEQLGQ